jgi:hypothetical protein
MKSNNTWFLVVALLGACVDGPHPKPDPIPTATVSGVVEVDTAIQNATVYLDLNDDNQLDSWEPQATTDATGHFTLTWEYPQTMPPRIGAVVDPTSIRVGATGSNATVGMALHMRAPLGNGDVVVSPLTTLVASEMAADPTLTLDAAKAKIGGALSASKLAFSGQPLDVMTDYTAGATADAKQLRYVAGGVAAIVSTAVQAGNGAQSYVDCNDPSFFNPAIVAMDKQLTTIANGAFSFSQLPADQQTAIAQNPGNYFIDTQALADEIEAELAGVAAALFYEFEQKFVEELGQVSVELGAELIKELVELFI